uniref:Solute carrier family 40 member n=1 Tax=Cyprinus carpio TaxID=7962 RepID=A0A8C1TZX3_CYPCA
SNKSFKTLYLIESALIYLKGPKFLIYVSGALSMWGDRMWHFAISVFLIELYGHNLLLTGIFGLVVAGSVLLLGALIGDWVDRNPRNKVAHASLFIQNISVTVCSIVLMLVFSYKKWIEEIWDGWLTVVCYTVVIVLADVANLASTALTIAIQRDWIVVITGYNRGHLAGMNATMRRIDQVTNILAPLAVGQVMTLASNVVGCGFILGWNLVSLIVEFIFLSRVYRIVPALSAKPPAMEHQSYLEKKRERKRSQGKTRLKPMKYNVYLKLHSYDFEKKKSLSCSLRYFFNLNIFLKCLWSFDLTVTQLLQETICESERGVVNGVQSSMNYLMDLLHFIMVISAPQPQHFGILVIISILFIFTGHTMYFLKQRLLLTVKRNTIIINFPSFPGS